MTSAERPVEDPTVVATAQAFGEPTVTIPKFVFDRFEAEWESSSRAPDFDAYLPDAREVRRTALIGLIRIDLRYRWLRVREPKRLAEYCAEWPELRIDRLPADLVHDEFVIRRQSGEPVDPRTYLDEYPAQAARLEQLLNTNDQPTTVEDRPTAVVRTQSTLSELTGPHRDPLEHIDVGQQIGEFDLLTNLGSGAFARVFLARQRSMQRLVAVKVSEDHGSEPQTLAQLDHDHIVRVFDQRLLTDRPLKLLYMQYLPGGTLLGVLRRVRETPPAERDGTLLLDAVDHVLAERGEIRPSDSDTRAEIAELSWPETVAWLGARLAHALDYADRHGVLHRDVKPANVLLTGDGSPKLADFNISFNRNVAGASPVEYFGGSLSYMSPEQLDACRQVGRSPADLDTRSDIYALGVVLWEALTGFKPFPDDKVGGDDTTLEAMLERRAGGVEEAALAQLPVDTPDTLRRVLTTALNPDRGKRWSSGAEFAKQLELSLDQHARALVDPPPRSWRTRLRPWSIAVLDLGVVVPGLLAAYFNYYIWTSMVVSRYPEADQHRYNQIWLAITVLSFGSTALAVLYMRRYLLLIPHGLRKGKTYDAEILARARRDALLLADRIAIFNALAWIVWGAAMIVATGIGLDGLRLHDYVIFVLSVGICATISTAYPFFLVVIYAVRSLYPTFLPHGAIAAQDAELMRGIRRRSSRYLSVAAAIPLVGVAATTFASVEEQSTTIVAIRVLCVAGVGAFILVYWLFRLLEGDLKALEAVTSDDSTPIRDT